MMTLNVASRANQATTLPIVLIANYVNESEHNASVNISFEEAETLKSGDKAVIEWTDGSGKSKYGFAHVTDSIVEAYPFLQEKLEDRIHEWLSRTTSFFATDFKSIDTPLHELDAHLTLRSYIVGYTLTIADLSVWGSIRGSKVAYAAVKKGNMLNVSRWFRFVEETNPWIQTAVQSANAHAAAKKAIKSSEGASYDIALPDTDKGVVTRFPPEPS